MKNILRTALLALAIFAPVTGFTAGMPDALPPAAIQPVEEICAICRDIMSPAEDRQLTVLQTSNNPAGCHTFHNGCITPWLAANNTCPTCRGVVTAQQPTFFGRFDEALDNAFYDTDGSVTRLLLHGSIPFLSGIIALYMSAAYPTNASAIRLAGLGIGGCLTALQYYYFNRR